MRPYNDIEVTDEYIIREFNENIDPIELMWHRDLNSRMVEIIKGNNWKYQEENKLPVTLKKGDKIFIPKLSWHRIFLGEDNLIIKIQEK